MLEVKILGAGCPNCRKLEKLCRAVATENNLEINLEKVTDVHKFVDYGIMFTPGLVINGEVKVSGKLPAKSTLKKWLISAGKT